MKKFALIVGHKKASPGAINPHFGTTEYFFNDSLCRDILMYSEGHDINVLPVYRDNYRDLPAKINKLKPDYAISLHCNAYNKKATGTEILYYHTSSIGRKLARALKDHIVSALGLPDRGVKPTSSEGRGGYLLRYTAAPIVIAEPFFIDNDRDLGIAAQLREKLVMAYVHTMIDIAHGAADDTQ